MSAVTAQDLAQVAEQLAALQARLKAQAPDNSRALSLAAGMESALAEIAETLAASSEGWKAEQSALADLVKAVRALKFDAPRVEVRNSPADVTVNVPQGAAPVVHVEASKSWTAIEVVPKRQALTGEVERYVVRRLA